MIQNYEYFMPVLLKIVAKEKDILLKDVIKLIKEQEHYNEDELRQRLTSGPLMIDNRITWASTFLKKAGLIIQDGRGTPLKLTAEGECLLANNPTSISRKFLYDNYPSFRQWGPEKPNKTVKNKIFTHENTSAKLEEQTPEDNLMNAYTQIKTAVGSELLEQVLKIDPYKFETLILELLVKMGYGTAIATPKSNDHGIDGIINKDPLGLDKIYIQAKRYGVDNKISRKELQSFIGAYANSAMRGLFITTSDYTKEAKEYAQKHDLVLIDGSKLIGLMFDYDLGVQTSETIKLKQLDEDYFNS